MRRPFRRLLEASSSTATASANAAVFVTIFQFFLVPLFFGLGRLFFFTNPLEVFFFRCQAGLELNGFGQTPIRRNGLGDSDSATPKSFWRIQHFATAFLDSALASSPILSIPGVEKRTNHPHEKRSTLNRPSHRRR
jgi:hypothetical protein